MTPRGPYRMLLVFAVLVLAIYLAFPTCNYYWDGVGFAAGIEHPEWFGDSLVRPNFLLYLPFGRAAYVTLQHAGLDVRALQVAQALNSIAGACCVFVLGSIVLDWSGSAFMALLCAALMAFSAGWWRFATDGDPFILPTLFLTLAFRFVLPWQPVRPMSVAALHAAAILFHKLSVLFWPAAVIGICMQAAGTLRRSLAVLTYSVAVVIMTVAPYMFAASRAADLTPSGVVHWIAYRSPGSHFEVGRATIAQITESHVALIAGGPWTLGRRFHGWPTAGALVLLAAFVVLIARRRTGVAEEQPPGSRETRGIARLAVVWIAPWFVFLCFWSPQSVAYRVFYFPAVILLIAATAVQRRWLVSSDVRTAAAIGVAVLAVWNFCVFIYPNAQEEINPTLVAARQLRARLRKDAMVYVADLTDENSLVQYENPQTRWMRLSRFDLDRVQHDVVQAAGQGRDVWLDASAVRHIEIQSGGAAWVAGHTDQVYRLKRGEKEIRFVEVHP